MKKITFLLMGILVFGSLVYAETNRPVTYGWHVLAGGRYDDLRMCVGSPAGIKGGPIMDVYADILIPVGEKDTLVVNIPVMRPILFGAAFQMLQFEPQITYEHHLKPIGSAVPVLGGGLGLVCHYGPDYESSSDDRGDSFAAAGPLFSGFAGMEFAGSKGTWMPGVKIFYAPLFSEDYDRATVAGAALELHYRFQ